jgi:archaemetzincin
MIALRLLPIGPVGGLLQELKPALAAALRLRCDLLPVILDPDFAFHAERQQYHSSELLERMQACIPPASGRLLGVTAVDLYIPILTYVFGEAQLDGACAVVSVHRLRQQFYGLPPDPALEFDRLLKESVHELGHTFGLRHCPDYECAMSASHAVEWIDLKSASLCPRCHQRISADGGLQLSSAWPPLTH